MPENETTEDADTNQDQDYEEEAEETEVVKEKSEVFLKGTRYRVYASQPNGCPATVARGTGLSIYKPSKAFIKKRTQGGFVVSPVIENFLRFQPKEDHDKLPWKTKNGEQFWDLRTEATITLQGTGQKINLRCHPNYRNEGPWFDWVIVHFETDEVFEKLPSDHRPQYQRDCVPCKILAFAEGPNGEDDQPWILVHGCQYRKKVSQSEMDSCLLEHWELAYHDLASHLPNGKDDSAHYWGPQLSWIRPNNILCRCLVVEEEPGIFENVPMTRTKKREKMRNKVLLIKQRRFWPLEFTH